MTVLIFGYLTYALIHPEKY
ncbi:potassium-transporting ATPase subunit F [Heyndrickxia vini]